MRESPLAKLTAGSALAFAVAVIAVYPLYIDRFSNLGVTKFAGVSTLFLLFMLFFIACLLIGAQLPKNRWSNARHDPGVIGLLAFVATSVLATICSLTPLSSLWGLGSYYGGLFLVLLTAMGYYFIRTFFRMEDFDFLSACIGVTVMIVTVLYVLNILNIDLIGAYGDTAVVERAQFFSTLGQKDFNAGYMSVALPILFYYFLAADGRRVTALRGIPAVFGTLALTVVDAEGLLLGVGTAFLILICHRNFTTKQLRRIAFLGATFFAWSWMMNAMRASVYTQGGTPMLGKLGEPQRAIPGIVICVAIWLVLWAVRRGKAELELWKGGRVLTAVLLAGTALIFMLRNLMPGFPSLGTLDNFFLFNDSWGTYRGVAWKSAWGVWADAPLWRKLFGYGPGMMHTAVKQWAGAAMTARMNTFYAAHNEYLEQLLTTGLAGLVGWLLFALAHLWRGRRFWGKPGAAPILLALCSYLAQATVSIRVSMIFPEVMLLFGMLGALGAPEPAAAEAETERARTKRKVKMELTIAREKKARCLYLTKAGAAAVAGMVLAAPLSHAVFALLF
jgi:O-antigen ligase